MSTTWIVVGPVLDGAAVSLGDDEPELAKVSQLVRHSCLLHANDRGERADAEGTVLEDTGDNPTRLASRI